MSDRFQTTHWSLVLAAAEGESERAREALAALCEAYWQPLYVYIRRQGFAPDQAEDLTQGFFLRLLEKKVLSQVRPEAGRFRSFLLTALSHFLANERDRERALKRRPSGRPVPLDAGETERSYLADSTEELNPERVFERRWALTVLGRVLLLLRREFEETGAGERFEKLKVYLTQQRPTIPYGRVAAELNLTESAIKVAVHRIRRRFGQLLREEVGKLVADPREVDDEIRHLLSIVAL